VQHCDGNHRPARDFPGDAGAFHWAHAVEETNS
jgi:hypothetical protein